MNPQQTESRFQTTSWTLIVRAPNCRADMEALLNRYRWPVYAYLRRKGKNPHDAEDLTQGFLCDVLLDGNLLHNADRSRGRFRSFLMRSLEHFVIDAHRSEFGRPDNRPKVFAINDLDQFDAAEPLDDDDPQTAFDRQWATTVFNQALTEVEREYRSNGMERQWIVFEERLLRPALHGCEPTSVRELMTRLELPTEQKVYSMLQTIQRRINGALRRIIEETLDDSSDVDAELDELLKYLRHGHQEDRRLGVYTNHITP